MNPHVLYMPIILSNSNTVPITVLTVLRFDTFRGRLEKFVLRHIFYYLQHV